MTDLPVLPGAPDDLRWWTSSCGRIEFRIGLAHALGASHPGPCDADVACLRSEPYIAAQLAAIPDGRLTEELGEYGAWDEAELADREANLDRLLWLACGDIAEDPDAGLE